MTKEFKKKIVMGENIFFPWNTLFLLKIISRWSYSYFINK